MWLLFEGVHLDTHAEGEGDGDQEQEEGEGGENVGTESCLICFSWNQSDQITQTNYLVILKEQKVLFKRWL